MSTDSAPDQGVLRKLIDAVLPLDSDLEAFCLDSFPHTARNFSDSMERKRKVNLLLTRETPAAVIEKLQRCEPDQFEKYRHLPDCGTAEVSSAPLDPPASAAGADWDGFNLLKNPGARFVGREDELRVFTEGLTGSTMRIGIATGPGGMGKACASMKETDLVEELASLAELPNSSVQVIVTGLILQPRKSWDDVPAGMMLSDIQPWHFNRRLSYLRKPLLSMESSADLIDNILYWGPRHVERACRQLIAIITNGRYKLEHTRSQEMKRYRGNVIKQRGKDFELECIDFLGTQLRLKIYPNLGIGPNKQFQSSEDLGDIDVLGVDISRKWAFACECKDVDFGRSASEIGGELDRLYRGNPKKPQEATRAAMHLKRIDWLSANWSKFCSALKLPAGSWRLLPVMIIDEEIPSTNIFRPLLPIIPISTLKREEGIILEKLMSQDAAKELDSCAAD